MGGKKRKKKSSGRKERKSNSSLVGENARAKPPTSRPTRMAAADLGEEETVRKGRRTGGGEDGRREGGR
jgi:hypothetical protein